MPEDNAEKDEFTPQPLDDEDDPQEWLVTFADLTMLLLVFFVLLYSMSVPDENKISTALTAVTRALGGKESRLATSRVSSEEAGALLDQAMLARQVQLAQQKVFSDVKFLQTRKGLEGVISANFEDGVITLRAPGDILFAPNEATLSERGKAILVTLKDFFDAHPEESINIRGYTDDRPPQAGARFRDNWELSAMRAVNVLRDLLALGVESKRLTATGLADMNPLYPNVSDEYRAQNRRVEFVLVRRVTGK